jgi:glutamate dehydrogenase
VRAATETDEQVGDRANDGVRVTADEIRAQVIGEGANLALTQRGRIELAARGVRLNTDFIDNSAGVNSSDLEVNIKIGLGPAVGRGELDAAARAAFLASMTDAVAQRCLVANRGQSLALSLAERDAARGWREFAALMRHLEVRGLLDRKLEALPDDGALETRTTAKRPLTRPELATLLSYAKIAMTDDLLASTFPDQPLVAGFLTTALPAPLSQRFGADVAAHPLRREIVATAATNDLIDRLGPAAPLALAAATGRSMAEVTLGASLLDQACGFDRVWAAIHGFDGRLRGEAQLDLYRRVQRSLRAAIRSLLSTSEALTDPIATARTLGAAWAALPARAPAAGGEMPGDEAALVRTIGDLDRADGLWSIARLAADTGAAVGDAQAALAAVAGELHTQVLRDRAESLVATDVYEARVVTDALAAVARAERQAAAHRLQGKPSAAGRNQIVESVLAEPRLSVAGLVVAANALQAT